MTKAARLTILLGLPLLAATQPRTDSLLARLLRQGSPLVQQVMAQPDTYRLQIIYTQIDLNSKQQPRFRHYFFHYDPSLYFNPASTVKMPLAFLSLEKLRQLQMPGMDAGTAILFDSSQPWMRPLYQDTTAASRQPSIAHFIKKAFLISDNDAYNRMYQWLGQQSINRQLHQKGYAQSVISRQFMGLSLEQNRHTNGIRFVDSTGHLLYAQAPQYNPDPFDFSRPLLVGHAHMNARDSLIAAPFDFSWHNNLPLFDLHQMLQSVMFPASMPARQRFDLSEQDYQFLRYWLSAFPSETDDPKYDTSKFYNSYVKFFFRDSTRQLPAQVRVFNKVGWAYGFLTDISYVADFENKVEYMLSATLYVNSDGIVNDGKYDYDSIGYPFLRQLGQLIYQYELGRSRKHAPDLSPFRFAYGIQDPANTRPAIREADN